MKVSARRLLGWGVDALITDRPDLMVPLADPYRAASVKFTVTVISTATVSPLSRAGVDSH